MDSGIGEERSVQGVIRVMVREDHIGDLGGVHAEPFERLQDGTTARNEARIDDNLGIGVSHVGHSRCHREWRFGGIDVAVEKNMHIGGTCIGPIVVASHICRRSFPHPNLDLNLCQEETGYPFALDGGIAAPDDWVNPSGQIAFSPVMSAEPATPYKRLCVRVAAWPNPPD